jgi:hypothetical protein
MPLTALKEPSRNYAGGVRFAMINGPTRVICWVAREALERRRFLGTYPARRRASTTT